MKPEEIPDYGEFMLLGEFVQHCKNGMFVDYDGSGLYADMEAMYSDKPIFPSEIIKGEINTEFSHVVWFNR